MSYRPDLEADFEKLIDSPFGTQAVKYVSTETEARTIQSWYRGQVTKFNSELLKMASQGFEVEPVSVVVSRQIVYASKTDQFKVVATKLHPPTKTEFVYPKEVTK